VSRVSPENKNIRDKLNACVEDATIFVPQLDDVSLREMHYYKSLLPHDGDD